MGAERKPPLRNTAPGRARSRPRPSWWTISYTFRPCIRVWRHSMRRRVWSYGFSIPRPTRAVPKVPGPSGFKHRGIAYWSDGDNARIFLNSRDRLYAINASSGKLETDFGKNGSVLLTENHGRRVTRYEFDQTSPPVVFENLVIVGRPGARPGAAQVRPTRNRSGIRCSHGRTPLGFLHHPAIKRRFRRRHVGR